MDNKDWVDSSEKEGAYMKFSWSKPGHEKLTVEDDIRRLRHPIREKPCHVCEQLSCTKPELLNNRKTVKFEKRFLLFMRSLWWTI
jgi:hypothetical protein